MYDRGHFCLIICPKRNCEEKSKKQLYEDIFTSFISHLFPKDEKEAHYLMWNPVERSPLFKPNPKKDCAICFSLNQIFKKKDKKVEDIMLFSHNILDINSFKSFFTPLFNNNQIEKIYYLELDHEAESSFQDTVKHNLKKLKTTDIFDLKESKKFKMGVVYEIIN